MNLALDPASTCGWATWETGGWRLAESGVWKLLRGGEPTGLPGSGIAASRLREHLDRVQPKLIVVEKVVRAHKSTAAQHRHGALLGALSAYCFEHGVPLHQVNLATVKKLATGRGDADKQAMVLAAKRIWGKWIESPDQADALWVMRAFTLGAGE